MMNFLKPIRCSLFVGAFFLSASLDQALAQADVESFVRRMDGLKLFLKADGGVEVEDNSGQGRSDQ